MRVEWIRGRASRSRSIGINVIKTLLQTILFWTFFLAIIPLTICWIESSIGLADDRFDLGSCRWIGPILFAAAGALGIWSGLTMAIVGRGTPLPMDCASSLVIAGPYRFVRNPMVIAGLTQGIAVGLWIGSIPVIVYALLGAPVWIMFVQPWEERDLSMRFPDAYEAYRRRVRCWIPTRVPYRQRDALVLKEASTLPE